MAEFKENKSHYVDNYNSKAQNSYDQNGGPAPPSYSQASALNIALNSDFVSSEAMTMTIKGRHFSRDLEVTDATGKPIFAIDNASFSASHAMTVIHSESGQSMFTIHKKSFSMSWRYSAELPPEGSGNMLFETETQSGFFSSGTTFMTFRNAMNNGEKESLEVELHRHSGPSEVKYRGQKIADIDRESFSMTPAYTVNIHVGGVDPLIMVVLTAVIKDRIRTKKAAAANH